MKANIQFIQKKRKYSKEFKLSILKDFESGKFSVLQLSRLHGVGKQTIYTWIYKFSNFNDNGYRVVEMNKSSTDRLKQLEKQIKELEQIVGQKQIKIDYLETMIDVAKDELNIDIKKNFNTLQSKGSGKIDKK
jgi:transposase-like protein